MSDTFIELWEKELAKQQQAQLPAPVQNQQISKPNGKIAKKQKKPKTENKQVAGQLEGHIGNVEFGFYIRYASKTERS